MTKGNKIRLLIWGFIWLIILGLTATGIYAYYTGHGQIGKIRQEIKPIVISFNNLNGLNTYKNVKIDIKAKLKGKNITVTYKTLNSNLSYTFEYLELNNNKYLYAKFKDIGSISSIIIKEMIEAVSVSNGNIEGEIFNKFEFDDFYKTKIDDGVLIKNNNSFIEVYININKTILDSDYKKEIKEEVNNNLEENNNELK